MMNATDRKSYWNGYYAMKRLAASYYDAWEAWSTINASNASDAYVRGAYRAYNYIQRVGISKAKL